MSTIIKVRCTDQVLTFENTPVIASGGLEEDFVSFEFCSKWDGLVKTAVFWRSEKEAYHVLLEEDDTCPIPPEVLTVEGVIYFGVFGVSETGKQRTSEVLRYNIVKGAITEDSKPSDPTPDIYTQILAEFLRFENEITARVDEFTLNITTAWYEYQTAMGRRQNEFENTVTNRQTEFEAEMDNRQDVYESNINQQWQNFKTGGDFVLKTDYLQDQEEREDWENEISQEVGTPAALAALAALLNLDSTASVVDVIAAVKNLADQANTEVAGRAKVQTGSYVGTGTYGKSNPTQLTFNFVPKLVFWFDDTGKTLTSWMAYVYGSSVTIGAGASRAPGGCQITLTGNTLSWYTTSTDSMAYSMQANRSGYTYTWVAIG